MRPGEGEFEDLRLAAKASDRGKAAQQEWPAFEERLKELGYSPRAIAHAFRTLSGPGTVAEALDVLRAPMRESHPIALTFEVTETRGGPSEASRVTITSVERDDVVIHVNYEIVPPLAPRSVGPEAEAMDDLGNDYGTLGSHFGISGSVDTTGRANTRGCGRLTLPLPPRWQRCFASGSRGTCRSWSRCRGMRPSHRSGRDRRTKSASRSRIDRFPTLSSCSPRRSLSVGSMRGNPGTDCLEQSARY